MFKHNLKRNVNDCNVVENEDKKCIAIKKMFKITEPNEEIHNELISIAKSYSEELIPTFPVYNLITNYSVKKRKKWDSYDFSPDYDIPTPWQTILTENII